MCVYMNNRMFIQSITEYILYLYLHIQCWISMYQSVLDFVVSRCTTMAKAKKTPKDKEKKVCVYAMSDVSVPCCVGCVCADDAAACGRGAGLQFVAGCV